jgi:hypothetical protein
MSLSSCNIIKTFVFSTLYTTITNSKLKDWLNELVQQCFLKMNGQRIGRYKYLELRRDKSYFVKTTLIVPESSLKQISSKYSSCIDNIFLVFGGHVFQHTGIPMDTQNVLLFSPTCYLSYETDFIQGLLRKNEKKLT